MTAIRFGGEDFGLGFVIALCNHSHTGALNYKSCYIHSKNRSSNPVDFIFKKENQNNSLALSMMIQIEPIFCLNGRRSPYFLPSAKNTHPLF